ncbi:MAG: DUF3108 domain-containing protein [Desulfuromonadales bacterium]|nr:DUF3108 domain-containing protein [Desulfuromonadales bacterium]
MSIKVESSGPMSIQSDKIRTLTVSIGLSVVVHLLVLMSLGRFGNYNFTPPVNPLRAVMVDLTKPGADAAPVTDSNSRKTSLADNVAEDVTDDRDLTQVQGEEAGMPPAVPEKGPVEAKTVEPAVFSKEKSDSIIRISEPATAPQATASRHVASATALLPPLRTAGEFMLSKSEKLSYLITLLGVPVGSVELEAKNKNGEVWITLRTRSNAALSSVYPVDDIMETRHIGGNFIITKIRQQEGTFSRDIGFTIFLRDKRVFWIDRTRNRYSNETIPNSEVLDTLSSFYYLRNRPLQVGKTELLHIYDGDTYAPVPVEILRQEEVRLRNLKKVDCLLLRHVKQDGGIFRRTGDMMIWLTNDENRVPVKVETSTPLGNVTIELVSAETQKSVNPASSGPERINHPL